MTKSELRASMLALRGALDHDSVKRAGDAVAQAFLRRYADADVFLLYCDMRNELPTGALISALHAAGKQIYLPKASGNTLLTGRFEGWQSLEKGAFGVMEPKGAVTDDVLFDVIAVPGVAFDKQGFRLGYGKGYYDRFLSSAAAGTTVGLAFDFQVVAHIDAEPHDLPVDAVLTECCFYRRIA